jgi:hypothetical protein
MQRADKEAAAPNSNGHPHISRYNITVAIYFSIHFSQSMSTIAENALLVSDDSGGRRPFESTSYRYPHPAALVTGSRPSGP